MRQASTIHFAVPAEELDATDIRLEQLADLADALVEQVGAVRAHNEQLQRTLEEPVPEPIETVGGARPVEAPLEDERDVERRIARSPASGKAQKRKLGTGFDVLEFLDREGRAGLIHGGTLVAAASEQTAM